MKTIFYAFSLLFFVKLLGIQTVCRAEEKKIGVIMGMTGGAAFHANSVKEGLNLALDELANEGKVYNVAWEDDRTSSVHAVTAAKLLSAKGYKLLIGPLWSFQTKALRPLLAQEGLVNVVPTGASDINGGADEAIFSLCPARSKQLDVLKAWYTSNRPKNALIFVPQGDWGDLHKRLVIESMKAAGVVSIWEEEYQYPLEDSLARTIMLKYRSKEIDSLFISSAGSDLALILKSLKTLKMNPSLMSTQDLVDGIAMNLYSMKDLPSVTHVVRLKIDSEFAKIYKEKYQRA